MKRKDFVSYWPSVFVCLATALSMIACDSKIAQNFFASPDIDTPTQYKTTEWTELMPPGDLEALLNPPDYIAEIAEGSMDDQPAGPLKSSITNPDDRYQEALISTEIRPELDGGNIRIAGYLVPLDFNDKQEANTFFAVPWFGACLHLPPPPPNQIILVHSEKGVRIDDLSTPYWVSGELHADLQENESATSAYSMTLKSYEIYSDF